MKFSVVVYGAPYSNEASASALNFSQAVINQGHSIYRLFFFSDGVHNANRFVVTPQDEINLQDEWEELIQEYSIDSIVCVTSGLKRGIINEGEAKRHKLDVSSIKPNSELSGLGQLIDAYSNSNRIISFG